MGKNELTAKELIDKVMEFGADVAGLADVEVLKKSPSNRIYKKLGDWDGVGSTAVGNNEGDESLDIDSEETIKWPEDAKTILVIAIRHPRSEPILDWWQRDAQPGGTAGNLLLIQTFNRLEKWLKEEKGISPTKIPYVVEDGGIFLKDACACAGVGIVGKNNMVITREFGPRVRLRALSLPVKLESTGPLDWDPCEGCAMPCRTACPKLTFDEKIYSAEKLDVYPLPGRTGVYNREICNKQMIIDREENSEKLMVEVDGKQVETTRIHYCRECEFACPVGKGK